VTSGRSLVLLLDADDLACVEAVRPEALEGDVLVFDLDVHLILRGRGIEHLTPWDILRSDGPDRLSALNRSLWDFWCRSARVEFEGIDLLGMARYRHRTCLSRMAFVAYVVERTLETLHPSTLVVFEERAGHGLNPPDDYHKMPVLFMLARGIAERCGIPVDLVSEAEQVGRAPYVDQIARIGAKRLDPVDPQETLRGRPFILFTGSGVDLIRQLPLIRQVHDRGTYAAVQLYKNADGRQLETMRAVGHPVWHDSQVTYESPPGTSLAFIDRARAAFDAACAKAPAEVRCVFTNPYLQPHFDFVFGSYLRSMAGHVRAWRRFFARCRPELVVTNYVAPINDVAAAMGIPGLALTHALMLIGADEWFHDFPGFHIGAISEPHRERLLAAGLPADRVHVTGDPRIDEILHLVQASPGSRDRVAGQPLRRTLGVSDGQHMVLLLTGRVATLPHENGLPNTDWADAVRCFDALTSLAERRPEWRWVIKPHPRFDQIALYELANTRLAPDRRFVVVSDVPLDDLVQAADVAVVFNLVSSSLIEASFRPRPVIMLSRSMPWYSPAHRAMDGWLHATSVEELETELDRLFGNPDHYQARVRQTHEALRRYLGSEPGPTVPTCLRVIEEILDTGRSTRGGRLLAADGDRLLCAHRPGR